MQSLVQVFPTRHLNRIASMKASHTHFQGLGLDICLKRDDARVDNIQRVLLRSVEQPDVNA